MRLRNRVVICGKLVILKTQAPISVPPPPGMRGEIKAFSAGARFRLLKLIAMIDWSKLREGRFVTLTYPDSVAAVTPRQASIHRHLWMRSLEKHVGKRMPIIWRKEQQIRKSGQYRDLFVQHFHLCVFCGEWLDKALVRQWWRKALHVCGDLATDVKAMNNGEHAAFYLAKYLTKTAGSAALDYSAYLSKPGRAWGVHRKELLPMCKMETFPDVSEEDYAALCEYCKAFWPDRPWYLSESFTLLGQQGEKAAKDIREFLA
jgi:hypothetical protein